MSDLLNQASLVYIPSGYKEDTAYSVIPTDGSGDLTFTRASDGTRVNSQGLVERVPWNLVQYSEQFDNAYWNKYQSAVTSNSITAPNGTTTADKLEFTASGTAVLFATSTAIQSQIYTLSCYGKKGATNFLQLGFTLSGGDKAAQFNLNTGVVSSVDSGVTATIESVGNGWYRCQMYLTTDINSPNIFVNATTGTTGDYIYIWGAQLNIGSTAKPYFPTTDRQNVPRLTYEGGCPSLLLEPQRTNLVTYSEQFDDSSWNKNACTISANVATDPSGYVGADKFIPNNGSSAANFQKVNFAASGSTAYSFSVFVKASGFTSVDIGLIGRSPAYNGGAFAQVNLSTGVITSTYVDLTWTSATSKIDALNDGWYRVSVSGVSPSGTTGLTPAVISSTTGNGTDGILVWGAQTEAGSYPTSYIPTTSAAVTRIADAAYKTGISSLIGQTEGTLFVELKHSITNTTEDTRFILSNNTYDNWLFFSIENGTSLRYYMTTAGVNLLDTTISNVFPTAGVYKVALAYQDDLFTIYVNGVQKVNNTNSTTIPAMSAFLLSGKEGITSAVELVNKQVNQAALFKTRLTNDQLAALTTL